MRTFVLIATATDGTRNRWILGTTYAADFRAAASNFAGEIVLGDALAYAHDSILIIGLGELRMFEPGPCTAEVLAKALHADPQADDMPVDAALERYRDMLGLSHIGLVIATAPEVPKPG